MAAQASRRTGTPADGDSSSVVSGARGTSAGLRFSAVNVTRAGEVILSFVLLEAAGA